MEEESSTKRLYGLKELNAHNRNGNRHRAFSWETNTRNRTASVFFFHPAFLFQSLTPQCPNSDPPTSPLRRTSQLRSASGATAWRRAFIKVVQTEVCTEWVGHHGRQEKWAGLPTLSPATACLDKTPRTCGGISMRHHTWRKRQLNPAPRTTGARLHQV